MPDNKKHHYVPRFYLRNFSQDGKAINLFNLERQKVVLGAPFKSQCYRDYYYGRDQKLEGILAEIEGASASIIRKIIAESLIPESEVERRNLAIYIMAQNGRTPSAVAVIKQMHTKLVESAQEIATELGINESTDLDIEDYVALSVITNIKAHENLGDLEGRLLIAPPNHSFITSDVPVAFSNQLFSYRPRNDAASPGWLGFQLFFPVSDKLMLHLFDASAYSVPNQFQNDTLQLIDSRDVDQLNGLQIASAFENIFFSDLEADIPRLLKLFGKWRSADKVKANIWKNGADDSGRVIAMQLQGNLARPALSFVRIRAKAKKFRAQFQRQRYQPAVVKRPSLQAREEGSVL